MPTAIFLAEFLIRLIESIANVHPGRIRTKCVTTSTIPTYVHCTQIIFNTLTSTYTFHSMLGVINESFLWGEWFLLNILPGI